MCICKSNSLTKYTFAAINLMNINYELIIAEYGLIIILMQKIYHIFIINWKNSFQIKNANIANFK